MLEPLPPIPSAAEADPAFDARALFDEGLAAVRTLSAALWTDHNTHDPGITVLELLAYALTDLAYRHALPIEDLLVGASDTPAQAAARFLAPREALPNRPLTELDWRKLLIDLPGVKNAWLRPADDVLLYADLRRRELRQAAPAHPAFEPVPLRGLYRVQIDFMDDVRSQARRNEVLATVRESLEASRNLCEDWIEVRAVRCEYFALCAELDLDKSSDLTEVAARVLFDVAQVLAPPVLNHDLATLLRRGLSLPDVFDGPLLEHGFIDDAELAATTLPDEIRLSDVIGAVMDLPGLRSVRSLVLNPIVRSDETSETAADAAPNQVDGDAVPVANPWRIPVRPGRVPRLSLRHGRLVLRQGGLPVQGWNVAAMPEPVAVRLAELQAAARARVEAPAGTAVPPAPLGRHRLDAPWRSFQFDFPALYGIGDQGLGERATPGRHAQVLQLQGWLLFFDQLMADQLALLSQAPRRLSLASGELQDLARRFGDPAGDRHVLASQVLEGSKARAGIDAFTLLYPPGVTARGLADAIETPAEATRRWQVLLGHLLARGAEDLSDYAAIMTGAFGRDDARLIAEQCSFLQQMTALARERAGAMRQRPAHADQVWNTVNVSGLERRLAALLGIADFSRRNLGLNSYDSYREVDAVPDSADEYRFRVRHAVNNTILLSSSTHYATPEAARAEMIEAIERAQRPEGYQRRLTAGGARRCYFNIVAADGRVIARRIQYFDDAAAMEAAIAETMSYLIGHYGGEGLYLVEHLLLRPLESDDPLLPICTDPGCADCSEVDPYSYRVHVILPAYAGRFQHPGFREHVEQTIHREMPAHILPTVCWVDTDHMARFEAAWRNWLLLHAGFSHSGRREKLQALIDALVGAKNVYPVRALFDCSTDASKPPFILGKTSLGSTPRGAT